MVRRGQESGRLTRRLEAARVVDDIFLCLRGVCYDWCSRNGAYDLEARMLECLELLLPGLRPGPEEEDTD